MWINISAEYATFVRMFLRFFQCFANNHKHQFDNHPHQRRRVVVLMAIQCTLNLPKSKSAIRHGASLNIIIIIYPTDENTPRLVYPLFRRVFRRISPPVPISHLPNPNFCEIYTKPPNIGIPPQKHLKQHIAHSRRDQFNQIQCIRSSWEGRSPQDDTEQIWRGASPLLLLRLAAGSHRRR